MSAHEDTLQALRSWLKLGSVPPGDAQLDDAQVIKARQAGPRPPKPYLTVELTLHNTQVGEDDEIPGIAAGPGFEPTRKIRGERAGQASVQAHGLEAVEWLELAVLQLRLDSIKLQHRSLGITINPDGGMLDVSALIDSGYESRVLQEFGVLYRLESAEENMNEAATVIATSTFESTHGDLVEVITEPEPTP